MDVILVKSQRWAVLISGRGSNLRALLESSNAHQIKLVITNKKNAYGVLVAKRFGIPVVIENNLDNINLILKDHQIQRIFLLGFMKILPQNFVSQWQGKVLNIHPSFLPHFKGLDAIEKAIENKGPYGVTVHEVNNQVDSGRLILQRSFKELPKENIFLYYHINEHRVVKKAFESWKNELK